MLVVAIYQKKAKAKKKRLANQFFTKNFRQYIKSLLSKSFKDRNHTMNVSGRIPPQGAKEEQSTFEKIKNSPAFTIGTQAALFGLGVLFIQSPLMDMLVPQL